MLITVLPSSSRRQYGLASPLFCGSLAFALAVAFVITVPVNRALIARGRGHAVVHAHHHWSSVRPSAHHRSRDVR